MKWFVFYIMFLVTPAMADVATVDYVARQDAAVVHKNGDETISGKKTFTDIPMIPTATLPGM